MAEITQTVKGAVQRDELTGTIRQDQIIKTETNVRFVNHLGNFLQIAGRLLGKKPITSVYFVQSLATEYRSRWIQF
jgi:hypothetical protein